MTYNSFKVPGAIAVGVAAVVYGISFIVGAGINNKAEDVYRKALKEPISIKYTGINTPSIEDRFTGNSMNPNPGIFRAEDGNLVFTYANQEKDGKLYKTEIVDRDPLGSPDKLITRVLSDVEGNKLPVEPFTVDHIDSSKRAEVTRDYHTFLKEAYKRL